MMMCWIWSSRFLELLRRFQYGLYANFFYQIIIVLLDSFYKEVVVTMMEYIKNIIKDFPEEITGKKHPPPRTFFFTVRDRSLAKALPEEQRMAFNCATAQVLFLSARARRDIQRATAFLTTRVRSLDEDNWGKVKRVLGYLKGTMHMPLILLADSLTLSWWWVDAVCTVHDDSRGHTGAGMNLRQKMALTYSRKQMINTKSELDGVDNLLGYILWACYFMIEHGYGSVLALLPGQHECYPAPDQWEGKQF